ncbi:hypothetical protein LIER_23632 [Lithospermum erythrorhizon]|uniref:Transmembrane protein n=1 Tax=Lithospermum erythrorhizon TaxID=34254 RepID=A0AAV3QZH8_LITER
MSLLNLKPCNHLIKLSVDKTTPTILHSKPISFSAPKANFTLRLPPTLYSFTKFNNQNVKFRIQQRTKEAEKSEEFEYLAKDGEVYQKTLRLVECAMFAAISGLVYVLSNSLTLENYFGCFFALPIVLSSVRWGVAAGRKTMVATVVLLFVLTGPVKALTYMLSHGLLGFTMGSMWRMKASWGVSIFLCTIVRAVGLLASVAVSSLLIGENILSLCCVSPHKHGHPIRSVGGWYLFHIWICASSQLHLLRLFAAFFVCGILCQIWNEAIFKTAKMDRVCYITGHSRCNRD